MPDLHHICDSYACVYVFGVCVCACVASTLLSSQQIKIPLQNGTAQPRIEGPGNNCPTSCCEVLDYLSMSGLAATAAIYVWPSL